MSIQAVAWALDQQLPAGPKLVLISIANHANHVDGYCWLSAETIAHEASCSPRSVYRTVGALVRNGYVRKAPRKGDDGKQRATDYWITFIREDLPWDWAGPTPDPEPGDDPQAVDEPYATVAYGETGTDGAPEPVDKPQESCGPAAIGVMRKNLAEPSKAKPQRVAREGLPSVPRRYAPPPQEPDIQGAVAPQKQIFVFEGSRAWEAWIAYKLRVHNIHWTLSRRCNIDGKWRVGWWFPSLFPPRDPQPNAPNAPVPGTLMTEEDFAEMGKGL